MHQEGNRNYTNNKSGLSLKVEMLLSKHKAGRCWSYWEGSLLLHRKARMACLHRCAFAVRSDRKGSTLWPREEHSAWREMQVKEFKQKWDWHLGGRRKIEENEVRWYHHVAPAGLLPPWVWCLWSCVFHCFARRLRQGGICEASWDFMYVCSICAL